MSQTSHSGMVLYIESVRANRTAVIGFTCGVVSITGSSLSLHFSQSRRPYGFVYSGSRNLLPLGLGFRNTGTVVPPLGGTTGKKKQLPLGMSLRFPSHTGLLRTCNSPEGDAHDYQLKHCRRVQDANTLSDLTRLTLLIRRCLSVPHQPELPSQGLCPSHGLYWFLAGRDVPDSLSSGQRKSPESGEGRTRGF